MLQLKGRSSPNKPVFFMNCGIHAREWVSPATCIYMIKQVCDCMHVTGFRLSYNHAETSYKDVLSFETVKEVMPPFCNV